MFDPSVYEAGYGLTLKSASVVVAAGMFSVAAIMLDVSWPLRIATLALFGVGGLVHLVNLLSRKVALRVDRAGIVFGGSPIRYKATTEFIPWAEVQAVVLFTQVIPTTHGTTKMHHVGVQRKPGFGPPSSRVQRVTAKLVPDVPARIVTTSRAVSGWRLDARALSDALPPEIRLIDAR
jgi:hypothetical protein